MTLMSDDEGEIRLYTCHNKSATTAAGVDNNENDELAASPSLFSRLINQIDSTTATMNATAAAISPAPAPPLQSSQPKAKPATNNINIPINTTKLLTTTKTTNNNDQNDKTSLLADVKLTTLPHKYDDLGLYQPRDELAQFQTYLVERSPTLKRLLGNLLLIVTGGGARRQRCSSSMSYCSELATTGSPPPPQPPPTLPTQPQQPLPSQLPDDTTVSFDDLARVYTSPHLAFKRSFSCCARLELTQRYVKKSRSFEKFLVNVINGKKKSESMQCSVNQQQQQQHDDVFNESNNKPVVLPNTTETAPPTAATTGLAAGGGGGESSLKSISSVSIKNTTSSEESSSGAGGGLATRTTADSNPVTVDEPTSPGAIDVKTSKTTTKWPLLKIDDSLRASAQDLDKTIEVNKNVNKLVNNLGKFKPAL